MSDKTCTLNILKSGARAVIKSIAFTDGNLANRLGALGLVEGTEIEVLRVAPLGDPMKIKALGYKLSLRLSEAASITVTLVK